MFGKVIAPLKVVYARSLPTFLTSVSIYITESRLSLDSEFKLLVRSFVSELNECSFCNDIATYMAEKQKVASGKLDNLLFFRESSYFSLQEKALLSYVEEITTTKTTTDATFAELRRYFSEKEIVEITWMCASENYYNLLAKPMGLTSDQLAGRK